MTPDPRKLDYVWTKDSDGCFSGPVQMETTWYTDVHALLCPRCLAESKRSTRKPYLTSIVVWLLLTVIALFVAQGGILGYLTTVLSFFILSGIPFLFVVTYGRLRRNPFLYYIGIGVGRVILKNEKYASMVMLLNHRMKVEVRPGYTGHKDPFDRNNCAVAFCLFGILPQLIMYIVSLLA